jgi:hypothetical protein
LKNIFLDYDGYNKKVNTPFGVDEGQWQRLVGYWMLEVTKKKSDQMKAAN